jgi:hypothetical protein
MRKVFCVFLFLVGASLFGTLLSRLNEILQVSLIYPMLVVQASLSQTHARIQILYHAHRPLLQQLHVTA